MRRLLAVVALLLVAAPAGAAPPAPAVRELLDHMAKGVRGARVGDWVTYKMDGGGARVHYWRLAVVGEERDKLGRDAVWVEMDMGTHPEFRAPLGQMRMLVARDEKGELLYDAVTRLLVGGPFDRPQEYSDEALEHVMKQNGEEQARREQNKAARAAKPPPRAATVRPVVRSTKESRLMTHAGTVSAVPVEVVYRSTVVKRMWMSREIPLMHLAKIEIPGIGQTMEVAGFGIDAKPRMVLPPPNAPKVRLEYADRVFPDLPGSEDPEAASPEVTP
ncbi:MAG TPA: hypothetical protein VE153_36985 [Myxococcus sp.]|nr:hypothetical protein [Myxococcus sp.]